MASPNERIDLGYASNLMRVLISLTAPGVTTHALSRQLGNSTEMIDRHYSKYSPLLNAEVHSGRK